MHGTVSDFLVELAQNAFEAGAPAVVVDVIERGRGIEVCVADDGPGMDEATRRRALDPFFSAPGKHPGRRVGLGLPFVEQAVAQAGGTFDLASAPGAGTSVGFALDGAHIDAPPAGDWAGAIVSMLAMAAGAGTALRVHRMRDERSYAVASDELAEAVGPLTDAGALALVRMFVENQESALAGDGGTDDRDLATRHAGAAGDAGAAPREDGR